MSYQAHPSQPAIKCDAPSCKASSDDYPTLRAMPRARHHQSIRAGLMRMGWVCALGIDLCEKHHDARYDHAPDRSL